jgi:TRAP-type transport system periplasmic protein
MMKKLYALLIVLGAMAFIFTVPLSAPAADYKAEYKLSTVVAKPMPWGIAGER